MKRFLLLIGAVLFVSGTAFGQVSITSSSTITIDFTTTVSGVNNGTFLGTGFANSPSAGQLDADAWATTGLSDGSKGFGVENTSGDHARGENTNTTGGIKASDIGSGNYAFLIRPGGSDWTPGTLTLRIQNNSGSIITDVDIDYNVIVDNDEGRANSFNFSYSSDDASYTSVGALDFTSTGTADAIGFVTTARSTSISSLSIADGAYFYIRWTGDDVSGSGSRDLFGLDDIDITPTLSPAGAPAKFAVTTVNGGSSPSTGTDFDVVIQLQDDSDNPVNATQDTSVTLSLATGTGTLGGTLTGTISSGNNTVTISGVTYDTAESGVSITATNTGGSLTAGTSSTFEVLAAADQLVISGLSTTGTTDIDFSSFTVTAQRSGDSSTDLNYSKSITLSIASGTGNLAGTTSRSASSGEATFDDISFDSADDFTIQAADGSLTSAASATITISDPEPSFLIISGVYDGQVSSQPKGVELFVTADIADLSSYGIGAANNGGGTDGQEFTFPADAASAGDFIYIASSTTGFNTFFGFDEDYTDGNLGINGDDAIELFKDGTVRDVFGDIDTDGTGQDWEYEDGWAYRKISETATTTFNSADWTFSGNDGLDNAVNASASTPFPTGTYTNGMFAHITGSAGWRILSSPTSDNTYDDLLADIWTQGIATGADATNGTANVQTFDNGTDSFSGISNMGTTVTAGQGFIVYVYSDDDYNNSGADAGFPKTLSVSGTENTGDVVVTMNSGASGDDSFSLAGNPYASTIDWDEVYSNTGTTNLTEIVYVYDHSYGSVSSPDVSEAVGGGYRVWTGSGATGSLTDGLIAPFQGFWVQNSAGSATLTIQEADKASGGTFYKEVKAVNFQLKSEIGNMYDETFFSFNAGALVEKDNNDAFQLSPLDYRSYMALASRSSEDLFDVNNLPTEFEEVRVPVSVKAYSKVEGGYEEMSGQVRLSWSQLERIPAEWSVILHDLELGSAIDLRTESEYVFDMVGSKTKARVASVLSPLSPSKEKTVGASDRFELVISQTTSVNTEPGDSPVVFGLDQNYPNPFNPSTTINYAINEAGAVNISVYNLMGQKVATLVDESKAAGKYNVRWNAAGAASGMYYYRLETNGQSITRKMTLIK